MDTKIKLLIFLLFTCLSVFGQEPPLNLAVRLQITSAVGSDPYTVTGIVSDDLSRFIADDIQVGDSLYVLDGSFVYVLGITSITSVVGPTIVFVANDPNDAGISLPTGQAAVIRPTTNYKLPTYISGLRDDLRSAIMNRQAQLIDNITGGGSPSITDFISAGQGVPPSALASANGGETWRNMTTGELWRSDGGRWHPFVYDGKECQDTVLVSTITVQSGGSVITGSPLVKNTSGVWEHMYNHPSGNNLIPDGVITDIITGPKALINYCGVRKGSGATPNTSYYVDQTVSTGFTTTKPTTNIRPLGKVASNGDFIINAGLQFSKDNFPGIVRNNSLAGAGIIGDTLRISNGDKGDVDVSVNGQTWTVDTSAITTIKIANSAVDSSKIAAAAVRTSDIGDGQVTMAKIAQSGATTGQVIKWDGTAWVPAADATGGGGVVQPLNQIVYGTGIGVNSKPSFSIKNDTLSLAGNIIVRPPVKSSTQFYPFQFRPQKNTAPSGYFGVLRIPMDSFAFRANNDPLHGKFPAWIKSFSWDNSINVPAGNPVDTTGNLIMNEGFNYDQSDPTYNPKFPKFYFSTEFKYRSGTNSKSWVENHWEYVDTLGRVARPLSMAYSYDGSYADLTITSDYKAWFKGRSQKALTPGIDYWENTNFITGSTTLFYPFNTSVNKRYTGNIIQKFSNKTGIDSYRNVLAVDAKDIVQVGDSAGVKIFNDLYFGLNNSAPAKIKAQSTVLRLDSMMVEFVSQPSVFRNFRYIAPGQVNSGVSIFDGAGLYWGKYATNEAVFGLNINAPNNSLFITSSGKLVYNGSSAFADFDLNQRTNSFGGGLRLLNTSGGYTTLRTNSNGYLTLTSNSTSAEKNIATTSTTASPEGSVSALPGSICMVGDGTTTGDLYIKKSGTGPSGWERTLGTTGTSTSIATLLREESFTATAAQTAFTIAYSAPAVSGTSVPLRVYRNGVRLFYVASAPTITQFTYSGTTVTTAANTTGDIITIEYLN